MANFLECTYVFRSYSHITMCVIGMGWAPKSQAPSECEHWNPEYERAWACALNLGPSLEQAGASISSIPYVVNTIFPKPKLKIFFKFLKSHTY